MASKRSTLALVFALLAIILVAGVHPVSAQPTHAVITNDTITIGVNQEGHLNIVTDPALITSDDGWLGLQFNPTGHDGLRHLGPNEGWGVAVPGTTINGFVTHDFDGLVWVTNASHMTVLPFTFSADSATSVVRITDGFNPVLEVTHQWIPVPAGDLFTPYLYQANVTIRNLTNAQVGGSGSDAIRYRRVMDWDPEPTERDGQYVTIGGMSPAKPPFVLFTSDDGFETPSPLQFDDRWASNVFPPGSAVDVFLDDQLRFHAIDPQPCGFTTDFTRCGFRGNLNFVTDHGALFDLGFPALAPADTCDDSTCDHRTFTMFYGAAPSRVAAELALYTVGTEVYSFANCHNEYPVPAPPLAPVNGQCDPVAGTPATFIFGVNGLGGNAAFGDIFGRTFVDVGNDGKYSTGDTPLAGVTLTVVRTSPMSPAFPPRTLVSDTNGQFDFTVLPHGTYTITSAVTSGGYDLTTANGLGFTIGEPVPCNDNVTFCAFYEANFGFRTGSIAGSIYGDADNSHSRTTGDVSVGDTIVTLMGPDGMRTTSTVNGAYVFTTVRAGTYTVSAPLSLGGLVSSTPNPLGVSVTAGLSVLGADIGYCVTTATSVVSAPAGKFPGDAAVFGDTVNITATVSSPCGSAVTTGSVLISIDGDSGTSVPVNASGVATTSTSSLGGGTHTITATYVSVSALQSSTGTTSQAVNPAPSTTTLTSSLNPSNVGNSVTFTAQVSSLSMAVSDDGTVTFTIDGVPGSPMPLTGGAAAITTNTLAFGSHAVSAQYSGVANYAPSSASLTQTVNDTTTTSVVSGTNPSTVGQSVTFTATVSGAHGEVVNVGAVTFKEGTTVLAGPITVDGAGHASFSTSTLSAGSHTITAAYAGAGGFGDSSGSVVQQVNNPVVAESCFTFDFREITYFKNNYVIMSSDATIRSHNGISGGFNPAVWPYNPAGGTNKTVSRGTLFRIYGFAASQVGTAIPNADNPAVTYTVQADPQIPGVYFIDLGGPAKVFICPSQLQIKLIEGTPVKSWNLPGTTQLGDASKNIPGVMLNHNVERIAIPARVRNELAALGTPLKNPNGTSATYGLIDYIGAQQWGHGNANFREHVDLQMQFVADDPANRPLHYRVGFHTATNRDFEGFTSCDYQDFNPGNDGIRMNDVWAGTNVGNPNWGPSCGSLEPSVNQRRREQYAVPKNAVQILTTVNTHDDTMRVFYGTIRPAGNSSSGY